MVGEIHKYPIILTSEQAEERKLLLCDGSYKSITAHSALYAVIGYTFGQSGVFPNYQFRVPDYRSIFHRGLDLDRGIDVNRGINFDYQPGKNWSHSHTNIVGNQSASHSHNMPVFDSTNPNGGWFPYAYLNVSTPIAYYGSGIQTANHNHLVTINDQGESVGMPDNCAVVYYIQYEELIYTPQDTIDKIDYIHSEIQSLLSYIQNP